MAMSIVDLTMDQARGTLLWTCKRILGALTIAQDHAKAESKDSWLAVIVFPIS